ncbi:MAG: hypothetical protein ACRED0_00315 [Gammaproteobacteria bacterium]
MSLQTIPLWDREVLLPTYTQLQEHGGQNLLSDDYTLRNEGA